MESGWQREGGSGHGMSTVHVAADEQIAAAINHIHSLPVERAFNLHAELHIAYGRCLPTFSRSFCRWLVQPGQSPSRRRRRS